MKGLEIKEKMKLWSKQIEGIVGTFCVRDIPEHAYMYHTHMKKPGPDQPTASWREEKCHDI